jgi:hypothetical protein
MTEDAARNYRGGTKKADLAKGHPNFVERTYELWDQLATEQALRLPIIERPAWKVVKLGAHKNADSYRQALKKAGYEIGRWANDMMGHSNFKIIPKPVDVELVLVTVAELGFPDGATRKDIYEKALSLDLQLCPPEVGPALRLDYLDQPAGEYLLVAMEPIAGSDGALHVFNVAHDDGPRWLGSYYGNPGHVWDGSYRWLFVRGK